MKRAVIFWRDTRHLWTLLLVLVAGGAVFLSIRSRLVPESFGQDGPYRAAALAQLASRPPLLQADATCLECHVAVKEERAESLHRQVGCMHCHGPGREHVAQARQAAESAGAALDPTALDPAQKWDGSFLTQADLYITKDRAVCLVCHEAKVGMPLGFKKISVAAHLDEMGAADPDSRETCFECHGGHNTAP